MKRPSSLWTVGLLCACSQFACTDQDQTRRQQEAAQFQAALEGVGQANEGLIDPATYQRLKEATRPTLRTAVDPLVTELAEKPQADPEAASRLRSLLDDAVARGVFSADVARKIAAELPALTGTPDQRAAAAVRVRQLLALGVLEAGMEDARQQRLAAAEAELQRLMPNLAPAGKSLAGRLLAQVKASAAQRPLRQAQANWGPLTSLGASVVLRSDILADLHSQVSELSQPNSAWIKALTQRLEQARQEHAAGQKGLNAAQAGANELAAEKKKRLEERDGALQRAGAFQTQAFQARGALGAESRGELPVVLSKAVEAEPTDPEKIKQLFAQRRAGLKDQDVQGRYDLAAWAFQKREYGLALTELTDLARRDPKAADVANLKVVAQVRLAEDQAAAATRAGQVADREAGLVEARLSEARVQVEVRRKLLEAAESRVKVIESLLAQARQAEEDRDKLVRQRTSDDPLGAEVTLAAAGEQMDRAFQGYVDAFERSVAAPLEAAGTGLKEAVALQEAALRTAPGEQQSAAQREMLDLRLMQVDAAIAAAMIYANHEAVLAKVAAVAGDALGDQKAKPYQDAKAAAAAPAGQAAKEATAALEAARALNVRGDAEENRLAKYGELLSLIGSTQMPPEQPLSPAAPVAPAPPGGPTPVPVPGPDGGPATLPGPEPAPVEPAPPG